MTNDLPPEAHAERNQLIADIHLAFEGVTREGGMSWSECVVADNYGSAEELRAARAADTDTHWTQVLDDPSWHPFPGVGGFSFIDEKGFKYYLAPTLIRMLRGEDHDLYNGAMLRHLIAFSPKYNTRWKPEQLRCIARFVAFMAKYSDAPWYDPEDRAWSDALEEQWKQYL